MIQSGESLPVFQQRSLKVIKVYEYLTTRLNFKGELHLDTEQSRLLLKWLRTQAECQAEVDACMKSIQAIMGVGPKAHPGPARIAQIKALLHNDKSLSAESRGLLIDEMDRLECQYDDLEERERPSQGTGPTDE